MVAAQSFLAVPAGERSKEHRERFLGSPETLLAICAYLGRHRDSAPAAVAGDASDVYHWIARGGCALWLFDERDYFLGETALLAGIATRHLGKREEAFLWLDRAEAGFRHTMNPAPGLASVAYARLALRFEMGRYQDVLELAPSLEASFSKLRMDPEVAKCRLLLATTLKMVGEHAKALELLTSFTKAPALHDEPALRSRILAEVGDLHQLQGDFGLAVAEFQEALSLLPDSEVSPVRANLKMYAGSAYKALGRLEDARQAFQSAQRDFFALEMRAMVAYLHLLVAEALLEMKRDREAEWEILAALPAIEEMKMLPEGVAAVALLRESVRRRKTDFSALRDLRARLEATS